MHLTLRQLLYFIEIVEAGNMSRAAERLHVATTALSLQVRAMEEHLGVKILLRHSRGVQATPAGRDLYRKAQDILAMVNETERTVGAREALRPRSIRLGAPPSVLRLIGIDAVLVLSRREDGIVLDLAEGFSCDLLSRVREGELDFALACEVEPSDALRVIDLIEERLVFSTAVDAARPDRQIGLAEALRSELVFYSESDAVWKVVHASAKAHGLEVNVARKVRSLTLMRQMVRRGVATLISPYGAVAEEAERGDLAIHDIVDHPVRRRTSLVWMAEHQGGGERGAAVDHCIGIARRLHDRIGQRSRLLPRGEARHADHVFA
jgi:LysR family transcriptional regulator, nitrogen assimilation regulatory protein